MVARPEDRLLYGEMGEDKAYIRRPDWLPEPIPEGLPTSQKHLWHKASRSDSEMAPVHLRTDGEEWLPRREQ